jgi:pyruvate,water dikinase
MDHDHTQLIIPFTTDALSLADVGGKAINLARLTRAGLPVPGGFIIPTQAYRQFVEFNQIGLWIEAELADLDAKSPDALSQADERIRKRFRDGALPDELAAEFRDAYLDLQGRPVAVRSSATAEDLPDLSFAGQQDSFLNVIGQEALERAIVDCWGSLWTARAIGYRSRNDIPHGDVALAVVVQEMVQAKSSGVMFTANPLNGIRNQVVIDATFGLGEALVGGHVEPDHYVLEPDSEHILEKHLGQKAVAIRSHAAGGTRTVELGAAEQQALPDREILALGRLAVQVEAIYGFPQDIEWAWADSKLFLLQSRPITSLYPIPDHPDGELVRIYGSFGAVQGMLAPMTPLGQDVIKLLFAGLSELAGKPAELDSQEIIYSAGERLWINFSAAFKNRIGRKIMLRGINFVEPDIASILTQLVDDPRFEGGLPRMKTASSAFRLIAKAAKYVRRAWQEPNERREAIVRHAEAELTALKAKSHATGDLWRRFEQRVGYLDQLKEAFPKHLPVFATAMAGLIPYGLIGRASNPHFKDGMGRQLTLELSRGLPHNVTTEMDLQLWEVSQRIRSDADALLLFTNAPVETITQAYVDGSLPPTARRAIERFLEAYGARGPAEIDFGQPRWRDRPEQLIRTLRSYLKIEDPAQSPEHVFEHGGFAAQVAREQLKVAISTGLFSKGKGRRFDWAADRYRALAGLRESPKFFIVQMMDIFRQGLLSSAQDLRKIGRLDQVDDIFFIHIAELRQLSADGSAADWSQIRKAVRARKTRQAIELRRAQLPKIILSDGHAFYQGETERSDGDLAGSPVSPGLVEGRIRIIMDPHEADLQPGEIMVCPGTDPAWTPLFLAAGGLIMEVGGVMTHGSVVAREYGIPAVVGVARATERLETGMLVRLDGTSGSVTLLDPP